MSFIRHYSKRNMRAGGRARKPFGRPLRCGRNRAMRAYVGLIGHSGLQRLIAEDVVPRGLLRELVRDWTCRTATVVEAVIDEDDCELIRRELRQPATTSLAIFS